MDVMDILRNIRHAIATSSVAFTSEEYDAMYNFIDELEK